MSVVCDTSPLILLAKIRRLDLLFQLYQEIVVPASVLAEVTAKSGKEADQIHALVTDKKCQVRQATFNAVRGFPAELGPGERETIALALESRADLIIIDDQLGRHTAREKGLTVTGTVGVLVEAKQKSLIQSLKPILDDLISKAGFWVSQKLYDRVLEVSHE